MSSSIRRACRLNLRLHRSSVHCGRRLGRAPAVTAADVVDLAETAVDRAADAAARADQAAAEIADPGAAVTAAALPALRASATRQ